jgi:hypothetical protein
MDMGEIQVSKFTHIYDLFQDFKYIQFYIIIDDIVDIRFFNQNKKYFNKIFAICQTFGLKMCLVSNFDIVKSELVQSFNLAEFLSICVPRLSHNEVTKMLEDRFNTALDRVKRNNNFNFAVYNYRDCFNNLNEYFYATAKLVRNDEEKKEFREIIQENTSSYLIHNIKVNKTLELKDNLSKCQKLLLLSAFIASELYARYDAKMFRNVKRTDIRSNKRKIRKKNECTFNMHRLLAIYSSLYYYVFHSHITILGVETISDVSYINLAKLTH